MPRWPEDPTQNPEPKKHQREVKTTTRTANREREVNEDFRRPGGKTIGRGGAAVRRSGLYAGSTDSDGKRITPPEGPATAVDVPIGSNGKVRLFAIENPPPLPDGFPKHAPHPPPGYRYDLRGKLVPLVQTRVPLSEPKAQEVVLEVLEITGSVRAACDAVGVLSIQTLEHALDVYPDFEERFEAALQRHRDSLYAAAVQRAVHGYEVPIVGGPYKDEIVAYERKYSDSLLALLLKRHIPEFREAATGTKVTINNTQNNAVKVGVDISKLDKSQRKHLRGFLEAMPAAKANQELEEAVHVEDKRDNPEVATTTTAEEKEVIDVE